MSLLKQIDDRGVVLEWSPFASKPNYVALATKDSVGAGFDEYGGDLEVHELDFSSDSSEPTLRGSVKTQSRFSSLAWSDMSRLQSEFPMGIVAGGMSDGHLNVWDADRISKGEEDPLVMSAEGHHQGAVTTLQFNPHAGWTHSLASGGLDGEVLVMSLERPDAPATYTTSDTSKHNAEITKVAWNTGTHYILASSDNKGSTCVWDMKQRKLWCEIRDPTNGVVSDIAWGPDGGTNLVTVSGDDRNPVIKYWDLKSSTSLPLATLKAHTEGILGVSWCKSDPYLLMSCGKDNRTIIWDLLHCKPVYEFPSDTPADTQQIGGMGGVGSSNPFLGGISAATGQKRYQATWAPHLPAVAATCSFDRRVQFYSMTGFKSTEGRAPKWLRRPVGATFSFGGKLVKFDSKSSAPGAPPPPGGGKPKPVVEVVQVVEDPDLISDCDNFHKYIAASDYKGLCNDRATNATNEKDREVWNIMNVICFSDNAREELQSHLGFDSTVIKNAADAHVAKMRGLPPPVPGQETTVSTTPNTAETIPPPPGPVSTENGDGAAAIAASLTGGSDDIFGSTPHASGETDFFGSTAADVPVSTPVVDTKPLTSVVDTSAADTAAEDAALAASPEIVQATAGMVATAIAGLKSEKIIRKAVVIGNFAAAVDCCIEAGLMAEALLLAQCGSQSLWLRTQAAFFEQRGMNYPFLTTLNAIIKSELQDYVNKSNVDEWRETLAVLSTYAKSEEFPTLCEILARRLESERNDVTAATLCFMCAANIYHVVKAWTDELNEANARLGYVDVRALQRYIEKVNIFTFAHRGAMLENSEASDKVNELKNKHYAIYANLLAAQGRLNEAPTYMKDSKNQDQVLIDRLYHSGTKPAGSQPPIFPFTKVNVTYLKAETMQEQSAKAAATTGNQYHPNSTNREAFTDQAKNAFVDTTQTTASNTFAQPASTEPQLPEGWSSAVDPTTGRTYYVNMKTNVSQWEAPPMPVVQQNVQATQQMSAPNMGGQTNMASSQPLTTGGAGVGNMGMGMSMSQPVSAFGGGVQTTPTATTTAVAEEPKVDTSTPATPIDSGAVNSLGHIINSLSGVATAVEKRQLKMIDGFYAILQKKVEDNEVSQEVMTKIATYVEHMTARNFPAATAVQIDLSKTEWTAHGKWINGLKMLVPIASKH